MILETRIGTGIALDEVGRPWYCAAPGRWLPVARATGLHDPVVCENDGCRECGCTDDVACPGGCSWVEPGLCSRCALVPA